jgi:hypothetical protein
VVCTYFASDPTQQLALFIWLIIRLIQLVFSIETVFFSHEKLANSVFQSVYNFSRTGQNLLAPEISITRKQAQNTAAKAQTICTPHTQTWHSGMAIPYTAYGMAVPEKNRSPFLKYISFTFLKK